MEPCTCNKEREIDKLLHAVYGNGEPGIRTALALIQQKLDAFPTPSQIKVYALVGSGLGVLAGFGIKLVIG
jgi:hypothetical protein